jgi:hypothetical protein
MSYQLYSAIDHINRQDAIPFEGDFKCVIEECGEQFDKGFGYQCDQHHEDKLCKTCYEGNQHLHWYQLQGLNDRNIYELTFKKI